MLSIYPSNPLLQLNKLQTGVKWVYNTIIYYMDQSDNTQNSTPPTLPSQAQATSASTSNNPELAALYQKIQSVKLPKELYEKAVVQLERMNLTLKYGGNIQALDTVTKYIDWIISLPWFSESNDILDIAYAQKVMNEGHYGLDEIKKRVLEYLAILISQKQEDKLSSAHAPILFFVGLAGTGKTTFAKSIANALGRKFVRIAFGGLSSAYDLRGVSKVQPEAEPGLIIKGLQRAGTRNPVILLDELDRIAESAHGEIMGVLIELLDPQQNDRFSDHYIDYPFDLSHAIFVATANNTRNIATAVMDRLEIIQMPSYTDAEKIVIAKQYVLPKYMKNDGLKEGSIVIEEEVWQHMARMSGFDPGIRSVERKVESVVRKVAFQIVSGQGQTFTITAANMNQYFD